MMRIVPERVKLWRVKRGWSQAELARRVSQKGITQQAIDKIERGLTLNTKYVVEIAGALGVSAEYLKGITDDPTPPALTRKEADQLLGGVPETNLPEVIEFLKKHQRNGL